MESAVREEEFLTRSWRKILCAVDFSGCSHEALAVAADLARRAGAELTIVHALETPPETAADAHRVERELARAALDAHQYLEGPIRTAILSGPAAQGIVQFADEGGFDLLVSGTRGRGNVRRILLGSVALALVSRARCPVLVVRPRQEAARAEPSPPAEERR